MALNRAPIHTVIASGIVAGSAVNLLKVETFNKDGKAKDAFSQLEFPSVKASNGKVVVVTTEDARTVLSENEKIKASAPDGMDEESILRKQYAMLKGSVLAEVMLSGAGDDDRPVRFIAHDFVEELDFFLVENLDEDDAPVSSRVSLHKALARIMCALAGTSEIPTDLGKITDEDLATAFKMASATEKNNGRYTEGLKKGYIKTVARQGKVEPVRVELV